MGSIRLNPDPIKPAKGATQAASGNTTQVKPVKTTQGTPTQGAPTAEPSSGYEEQEPTKRSEEVERQSVQPPVKQESSKPALDNERKRQEEKDAQGQPPEATTYQTPKVPEQEQENTEKEQNNKEQQQATSSASENVARQVENQTSIDKNKAEQFRANELPNEGEEENLSWWQRRRINSKRRKEEKKNHSEIGSGVKSTPNTRSREQDIREELARQFPSDTENPEYTPEQREIAENVVANSRRAESDSAKTAALNFSGQTPASQYQNRKNKSDYVDKEHMSMREFEIANRNIEYAKLLYEARTGALWDDLDVRQQEWHLAVYNISRWLHKCNYKVIADENTSEARIAGALRNAREFFGVTDRTDDRFFFMMVALYTGFAPDTHWFVFRDDQWSSAMPGKVFVTALEAIMANVREGKASPFAFRPELNMYMGGTRCVPIPIIPEELLNFMVADRPGNRLGGANKAAIRMANEEAWNGVHTADTDINGIHDIIIQDKTYPRQQRQALECMMDAIENINGTNYDYSGHQQNYCLSDMYDIDTTLCQLAALSADGVMDDLAQHYSIAVKAENHLVNKQGYEIDENGRIVSVLDIEKNPAMYILKTGADFIRGWALLTNPVVSIPATIEKVAGMLDHWGAQKILNVVQGHPQSNWKPLTQEAYQLFNSDVKFNKALENAIESFASGRRRQIIRAANNQGINSEKYKDPNDNPLLRFAHFVIEWGGKLSRGLPVFRNADVRRWFEYYWLAMCQNPNFDLTQEQLLDMFQTNPEDFLNQAMKTREGQAAATWVGDTVIGGANPLCEALYSVMSKHRVCDALTTLFVDQYFVYGFAVSQKLIPLSHTTQYLLTHALTAHDGDPSDIQGMLIGSHLGFAQGLLQNLLLDAQWIGTRLLGVCLMVALFSLLGLEPPDDPNKINVYGEWKIGGVAIQESWIFRDLLAPVFLTAMTIGVSTRGGDPFAILVSGLEQTVQDMPWFNVVSALDVIINWQDLLLDTQDEIDDRWEEEEAPKALSPEWWRIVLETEGLNKVSSWFEPTLFTQLYRAGGEYMYSNTMIYSTNPTDAADEVEQTSYEDAALRKVSNKHPFAALALDIMNGTFWPNNGMQKTGYFKWERPLTMISDPVEKVWAEHFTMLTERQFKRAIKDGDEKLKDFKTYDEYRMSYMNEIDTLMKDNNYDADLIEAQGVVIPQATRQAYYEYCQSYKELLYKEQYGDGGTQDKIYEEMKAGAITYDEFQQERQDAKDRYDETKDNINKAINALFSIRSGTDKYYVNNTGYRAYYTDADTGAPVNELEYGLRGLTGRDIEKNTYATNIAPQILPLWNAVPDTGNYDQEGSLAWQTEDTDLNQVKKHLGKEKFDSGFLKGENVWDTISQGVDKNNSTLVPGQRGLTPVPEEYNKIDTDKDKSEMWDPFNAYSDNDSSSSDSSSSSYANYNGSSNYFRSYSNYGYSRSYSRGYSRHSYGGSSRRGSSYTQKVYSRGSYSGIKTNYANTSYSKNLQYSKYGYLYPKVSTKGSRWGYRRQDM